MKMQSSGPALVIDDISRFEKEIGFALPRDYRDFLLEHNGGIPQPADFKVKIGSETLVDAVQAFHSLLGESDVLRMEWHQAKRELPAGWLPIGLDIFGETLCVSLKGLNYGRVFLTEGYVEYLGHKPHMWKLANSFNDFEAMLFDQKALEPVDQVQHLAAFGNKADLTSYLAAGGKLTDRTRLGGTLTQSATAHGNLALLEACFQLGGKLERCLTLAIRNKRWEIVRYLVGVGADVNEVDSVSGKTPLQSLSGVWGKEREEIEKILRDHGAKG
jgi:hypothetical protein